MIERKKYEATIIITKGMEVVINAMNKIIPLGIVLIIIGSILRYKAWGGLETFFQTNMQLFPPKLANNGRSGSKICKISTILDMTIFLLQWDVFIKIFLFNTL